jgi:hypothetical protein
MVIKAVAFDFGHTLIDERKDENVPLDSRPIHLMPEVSRVLPFLSLPLAVWANTRTANGTSPLSFPQQRGDISQRRNVLLVHCEEEFAWP